MRKYTRISLILFFVLLGQLAIGQLRNIYTDIDPDNWVKEFSFYNGSSGYVAFEDWVGFTQDTGRTYAKKYITNFNVNYNGNFVNLTFGFRINGVHAFSQDTLIVYGHYGFQPAIIYSNNGGNSFLLTYLQPFNQNFLYDGILKVDFPTHVTGYAVIQDRVLKTQNKGLTWSTIFNTAVKDLGSIQFLDANTGYLSGVSQLYKTVNAGNNWTPVNKPVGSLRASYFINSTTGWIGQDAIYHTVNSGQTWIKKSDPDFYQVMGPIHFINDSTGYGFNMFETLKTSDSGKIWERLERDNNFSFLGYHHATSYFFNNNIFIVGGGHGFIELTNNGGGNTQPKALFQVDLSALNSNSKIILVNKTKPGYSYKWLKNSSQFSTNYNTDYITNRLSIDTIKLVVFKGAYSDTAISIIDTRVNQNPCFSSFSFTVDTASVKFQNTDTAYGVIHKWYFGDGAIDSSNANPTHFYSAVGNYTVSHVVYNTIDHCTDSTAHTLTIVRTQNCLKANFNFVADTFYTNQISFTYSFDSTAESGGNPMQLMGVDWGDGYATLSSGHTYSAPGFYTVCFTFKNFYTGCINTVCKPVPVQMVTGCDAAFLINTLPYANPVAMSFKGKPVATALGKRNTWIINDWDKTVTGNVMDFQKSFFKQVLGTYYNMANNTCDPIAYEICIDSLNKTIAHIVYDSVSSCSDTVTHSFRVARAMDIYIKTVSDPNFPHYASFYAYRLSPTGDTLWYNTIWHVEGPGSNTYQGAYSGGSYYKFTYNFPYAGNYKIYVAANSCATGRREVYFINYQVISTGCGVFPFDFTSTQSTNNAVVFNVSAGNPASNTRVWNWGDSTISYNPVLNSHYYYVGGVYDVTLKYVSPGGCSQQVTKQVFVQISCNGNELWLDSELPQPPSGIFGYQWQVNTGSGWVNVPNTGVYFYAPNAFTAGPNMKRLILTGATSSFNGYQYRCTNDNGGTYKYFTIRFTNFWKGTVSNAWEDPTNWSCGFVPDLNTTAVISPGAANYPVIATNTTVYNLVINTGASLTVNTGSHLIVLH